MREIGPGMKNYAIEFRYSHRAKNDEMDHDDIYAFLLVDQLSDGSACLRPSEFAEPFTCPRCLSVDPIAAHRMGEAAPDFFIPEWIAYRDLHVTPDGLLLISRKLLECLQQSGDGLVRGRPLPHDANFFILELAILLVPSPSEVKTLPSGPKRRKARSPFNGKDIACEHCGQVGFGFTPTLYEGPTPAEIFGIQTQFGRGLPTTHAIVGEATAERIRAESFECVWLTELGKWLPE